MELHSQTPNICVTCDPSADLSRLRPGLRFLLEGKGTFSFHTSPGEGGTGEGGGVGQQPLMRLRTQQPRLEPQPGARGDGAACPGPGSLPGQWAWDAVMGSASSRSFLPGDGQLWEPWFPICKMGAHGLWRSIDKAPALSQASMVLSAGQTPVNRTDRPQWGGPPRRGGQQAHPPPPTCSTRT